MPIPVPGRPAFGLVGALGALLLLTGCTGEDAGPTLAQTKASAQLLRDDALERINSTFVYGVVTWKDESRPCGTATDDPGELLRDWHSTGLVDIAPAYADQTDSIMQVLAKTYIPFGWTVTGQGDTRVLSKDSSTSAITLTVLSTTGQLRIDSAGPCVMTGGPDSDEVRALENPSS
jgi:hypothetical protein